MANEQSYQSSYTLKYNGKNISVDVYPYLRNITYASHVDGKSEDLQITMSDSFGKWKNPWMVNKGATLELTIGDLNAGTFEIDEVTVGGPPDTITIKALATGYSTQLRTKKSKTHAQKTLGQIVNTVAAANGLTVIGTPKNILLPKVTQHHQTDLHFLAKLGKKYGHIVSVRKNNLVFMPISDVQTADTHAALDKRQISSYTFTDSFGVAYRNAELRYTNPTTGKTIKSTASVVNKSALDNTNLFRPDYIVHNYTAQGLNKSGVPFSNLNFTPSPITSYERFVISTDPNVLATLAAYKGLTPSQYKAQLALATYKDENFRVEDFQKPSYDTLSITDTHVDSQEEADAVSSAALFNANTEQTRAHISVKGCEYYVAGNNLKLTGFGLYSGMYTITDVSHTLDGSGGWVTELDMKQMTVALRTLKPKAKAVAEGRGGHLIDDASQSKWTSTTNHYR